MHKQIFVCHPDQEKWRNLKIFKKIHNIRYLQKIGQREEKGEEESMVPPNFYTFLFSLFFPRADSMLWIYFLSKTVNIRGKI